GKRKEQSMKLGRCFAIAILLAAGLLPFRAFLSRPLGASPEVQMLLQVFSSLPTTCAGDEPTAKPIAADLVAAIRNGDEPAIHKSPNSGAHVNARDADGNTPRLLAAVYAGPVCVELLLKKGADVNAANKLDATPLIRAATNYEKAKLLIDAGADVQR